MIMLFRRRNAKTDGYDIQKRRDADTEPSEIGPDMKLQLINTGAESIPVRPLSQRPSLLVTAGRRGQLTVLTTENRLIVTRRDSHSPMSMWV